MRKGFGVWLFILENTGAGAESSSTVGGSVEDQSLARSEVCQLLNRFPFFFLFLVFSLSSYLNDETSRG